MSSRRNKTHTSLWLSIGVAVLIILLLVWLTYADFFGDTDVAAFVTPIQGSTLSNLLNFIL